MQQHSEIPPTHFATKQIRWLFYFVAAFLVGVVIFGALQGRQRMSNRVADWLPEGFQETKEFRWFLDHFSEGDLLMVSWEGCGVHDERLEAIAERLMSQQDARGKSYIDKVVTGGSVYDRLTSKPLNLPPDEAYARMRGWMISQDDSQGCLVLYFSENGHNNAAKAIEKVRDILQEVTGLSSDAIHIAGPSIDSTAIDAITKQSQNSLLPFFFIVCTGMLFVLLRSWIAAFIVFSVALFNSELSYALIYYCGSHPDSITLLCCSLVFVLTISGGLHLLNYYRDRLDHSGPAGAVVYALKKAFLPCALACLTTILGVASLATSQVVPIRRFGVFSGLGLFLGTIFLFVFIGSILEDFPIKKWINRSRNENFLAINRFVPRLVIRHRWSIVVCSFLLFTFCLLNLGNLSTTVTFHGMFSPDAPVIKDYNYLENKIGGLVPIEVILNIPEKENESVNWLSQLYLLNSVEQALWEVEGVQCSLSALNFLPDLPEQKGGGFSGTSMRSLFNKLVSESVDNLSQSCLFDNRFMEVDDELGMERAKRWRISLRAFANAQIDYRVFIEKIRNTMTTIVAENVTDLGISNVSVIVTGGIPLAHRTQRQLLDDLVVSYVSAFILIFLTLVVLLRGFIAGVVAMIPNLFPCVLVFGMMAALGKSVDMGTMMTACVALGVSVDGTIHFITWFKQGMKLNLSQQDAIIFAYDQCSVAIIQATIICGAGMLVFAMSDFIPVSRFSWMLAILLFVALLGDLVLFPAILAGPAGRFVAKKNA